MELSKFKTKDEVRQHWETLWIEKQKREGRYFGDDNPYTNKSTIEQVRLFKVVEQWGKAQNAVIAFNSLPTNMSEEDILDKQCDAQNEVNAYNHMANTVLADWRRQTIEAVEEQKAIGMFTDENGEPTDIITYVYDRVSSETDNNNSDKGNGDSCAYGLDGFDPYDWDANETSSDTSNDYAFDDLKYDALSDFDCKSVNEVTDNFNVASQNPSSNTTDDLEYNDLNNLDFNDESTKNCAPKLDEKTRLVVHGNIDVGMLSHNFNSADHKTSSTSAEKNKKLTAEDANDMRADILGTCEKKNDNLWKTSLLTKGKDEDVPCFFQHNEVRSADGSFNVIGALKTTTRVFFKMSSDAELPEDKGFNVVKQLAIRDEKGKKLKTTEKDISNYSKEKYSHCKAGPNGTVTPCLSQLVLLPGLPTDAEAEKESKQFIKSTGEEQNRPRKVHGKEVPGLPGAVCLAYIVSLPATEEFKAATGRDAIYALYFIWVPRKPILDKKGNVIGLEKRSYGFDYDTTSKKGQKSFAAYCYSIKKLCKKYLLKTVAAVRKMPLLGTGTITLATNYKDTLNYQVKRKLNQSSRELSEALFKFDSTHENCKDKDYINGVNKITMNARYRIVEIVRGIDFMDGFRKISEYIENEYDHLIESILKSSEMLAEKYGVQELQAV